MDQIVNALCAGRVAPDLARADNSLLRCPGGIRSNIGFEEFCRSGYVDGGADGPDHCYRDPNTLDGKRHLETELKVQLVE